MTTPGRTADNFRRIFRSMMEGTATATVGEIVTYNKETRRATIQPLIMRTFKGTSSPTPRAIVQNVPVYSLGTKAARVHIPATPGDGCILIHSDRSLSNWLQGDGSAKAALDVRMHDENDAMAFLIPFDQNTDAPPDPDDVIVSHGDGEVRIKPNGNIQIGKRKGNKAAARKGDRTLSTIQTDRVYWDFLKNFVAVFGTWVPAPNDGGAALKTLITSFTASNPTPQKLQGKIDQGSNNVEIGD